MDKGTIVQYASIIVGALVAITLVSKHPVPIILLGICAAAYFIGEGIKKGRIKL